MGLENKTANVTPECKDVSTGSFVSSSGVVRIIGHKRCGTIIYNIFTITRYMMIDDNIQQARARKLTVVRSVQKHAVECQSTVSMTTGT